MKELAATLRKNGLTYKEIATKLGVSETTARRYCKGAGMDSFTPLKKEELRCLVKNCRMYKASDKEKAIYKKMLTIRLLDNSEYTFDCFYERMFFMYWCKGEKPSYAIFLHCLRSLMEQGYIENSDTGWLFSSDMAPDRAKHFLERLMRTNQHYYPTTAGMDNSYTLFLKLLRKSLVSVEATSPDNLSYGQHTHSTGNVRMIDSFERNSEEKATYCIKKLGIKGLFSNDRTNYAVRPIEGSWSPWRTERYGEIYHDFSYVVKDNITGDTYEDKVRLDFNPDTSWYLDFLKCIEKATHKCEIPSVIQRNVALSMTPEEYAAYKDRVGDYCRILLSKFVLWVTNKDNRYRVVDSWWDLTSGFKKFNVDVKFWSAYDREMMWKREQESEYQEWKKQNIHAPLNPYAYSHCYGWSHSTMVV